jgi:serine/threonine protein kinase
MLDGKYWITTRLGGGSLSEVLLARDRMLGQLVAIKVMRVKDDDAPPPSRRKMRSGDADLLREATALAKVRHPNIVQVQGWGRTKRDQIYLVLEYVEGRTLEDRLAAATSGAEAFDVRYALQIVRQLGGALATLHAAGIVHGDIKPDNVMLDLSLDRAVLIDFGLALGGEDRGGTPGYSAPEQFSLEVPLRPTSALDVYGLGAVAYAMLVGQAPFGAARGLARVAAQRRNDLTRPSVAQPALPRSVDAVLLRALALDPDERFDSILGFTDALEEAIAGTPGGSLPTARAREDATPSSRGSAFRRLRVEVQRRLGVEGEEALIETLSPVDRDVMRSALDDRTWYPTSALASYLKAASEGDLGMIEDLAITTTTQILPELLKSAGVTRTPATLLHIAAPLVYRFHDWGKMTIVRSGSHDATLTIAMPKGYAPVMCRVVTGALIALLRTASANAHVTQTRCAAEGASACEVKVTWAT